MITNGIGNNNITQWLASRAISSSDILVYFGVRRMHNGSVDVNDLYRSNGEFTSPGLAIRPVVSLKSNIQLEGNSEEGWRIK